MTRSSLILNVDDYEPSRYARTKVLSKAGFRVAEASSGKEALAMLESKPELVLLDVNLPDLNGFEVCRRIRENPETASVIVMHLTASSLMSADKVKGLESGADTYLTEPIDDQVLVATIRSLLRARAAEEALRRSNQDLLHLTHMLAHELREPLRAVTAYIELLNNSLAGRLQPVEEKFMDFSVSGAHRLGSLIDGVLLYARTIHELDERTTVDAEMALSDALQEQTLLISEAGATVEHAPLPQVRGSRVGLTRVFSNLISNAIRYRSSEPPRIIITAVEQGDWWMFGVRDNGIGIDPAYHKRIFDMFKRLPGSNISGHGIGLTLCRRVIENLGGTLWVDSAPGDGSTFYFTWPKA